MLNILGKLVVRTIERQGKTYKEGLLRCSLGKFYVKYLYLASLPIGEYEGFFTMTKIEPYCQSHQGKFLLGLEASIDKMAFISQPGNGLSTEETETLSLRQLSLMNNEENEESEETINADNDQHLSSTSIKTQVNFIGDNLSDNIDETESTDEDEALFGSLYPLGEEVELDASEDRAVLRQQVNRLKEIGYQFDAKSQKWALHFFE